MTEELTDRIQSTEEFMVILNGQIRALTGLMTHVLCLSTIQVAVERGDTNFARVAREMEDIASEQTGSVTEGVAPAVIGVALRFQREIFHTVRSQMKKEARVLRVAAMDKHRPR